MKLLIKYLFAPFRFLYKVYFGVLFFTSMLLMYPIFKYYLKTKKYGKVFNLKRKWATFLRLGSFIGLSIDQQHSLPQPPYIICANHGSYIDTVLMYCVIPDYFLFMGKGELLHWPLFRIFFYDMNIPVIKGDAKKPHQAFAKASSSIENGSCIALFPEGTIPYNAPKLGRFKNGAFKLAVEKQVPILPITFLTNYKIFGEPTEFLSPGCPNTSKVIIHRAIDTKGLTEKDLITLRQRVYDVIEAPLLN
jgi:1-acyl-sn-glycerol-3-phosphate acyltransferase